MKTTCFDAADSFTFSDICCQQFSLEQTVFAFFEKYLFCIVCCWSEHSLKKSNATHFGKSRCEWQLCSVLTIESGFSSRSLTYGAGVNSLAAELVLDAQQLVVFGNAFAAAQRTSFDLTGAGCD